MSSLLNRLPVCCEQIPAASVTTNCLHSFGSYMGESRNFKLVFEEYRFRWRLPETEVTSSSLLLLSSSQTSDAVSFVRLLLDALLRRKLEAVTSLGIPELMKLALALKVLIAGVMGLNDGGTKNPVDGMGKPLLLFLSFFSKIDAGDGLSPGPWDIMGVVGGKDKGRVLVVEDPLEWTLGALYLFGAS